MSHSIRAKQLNLPHTSKFGHTLVLEPQKRIYVNRSLKMSGIEAVGFDMDYTLAAYKKEPMDALAIEKTLERLITQFHYPGEIQTLNIDPSFGRRGLLVDKALGNLLKMDCFRYVKKAIHGNHVLSRQERRSLYAGRPIAVGSERFHWVDTLYALPELALYVAVVGYFESQVQGPVPYAKIFDDIRAAIDGCHADGTIPGAIADNLHLYVEYDPCLRPALESLKAAGKKLFLLTNSKAAFTEKMMSHLLGDDYKSLFSLICVDAKKPSFFSKHEQPFLDESANPTTIFVSENPDTQPIYARGNIKALEAALGSEGDSILYVGDHIYGDVLRAKKERAWRTMMIVHEMKEELQALQLAQRNLKRIVFFEDERDVLHDEQRHLQKLSNTERQQQNPLQHKSLEKISQQIEWIEQELLLLSETTDNMFHPHWGSLFKSGPETSLFGNQIEEYACLYSERVSNLRHYPATYYFRSKSHRLPHESNADS